MIYRHKNKKVRIPKTVLKNEDVDLEAPITCVLCEYMIMVNGVRTCLDPRFKGGDCPRLAPKK